VFSKNTSTCNTTIHIPNTLHQKNGTTYEEEGYKRQLYSKRDQAGSLGLSCVRVHMVNKHY